MHKKLRIAQAFCAAALLALAGFASPVGAVPLAITTSPQETSGPFIHNVFHTAGSNGGSGGIIKAWYDLDTGGVVDTYDPDTGAFLADFKVFSDSGLSTQIGTVLGTGSGLLESKLNSSIDGTVAGTITWEFMFNGSNSALKSYLGGTAAPLPLTMTFLSNDHTPSTAGRIPNSFLEDSGTFFLTLWGADGFSGGSYTNATLGTDLVVDPTVPVPEPATILIFGFGLLGLTFASRQRRLAPAKQGA